MEKVKALPFPKDPKIHMIFGLVAPIFMLNDGAKAMRAVGFFFFSFLAVCFWQLGLFICIVDFSK